MRNIGVVLGVFFVGLAVGVLFRAESTRAESDGEGGGTPLPHAGEKFCMDANGDGKVDISDPTHTLGFLFLGNPASVDCSSAPHEAPHLQARIDALEGNLARCEAELARRGQLPATGQAMCWDSSGTPDPQCLNASHPGQDGSYQNGCPTQGRFVLNDNGTQVPDDDTVTDTCTGLEWQRAVPVPKMADFEDGYQPAANGKVDWQHALQYCEGITFAGKTDWRLPNLLELKSIVNLGKSQMPLLYPEFQPTVLEPLQEHYWSSTTFAQNPIYAYSVYFDVGRVDYSQPPTPLKAKSFRGYFVRAVRGP